MALYYRVVVSAPATQVSAAKSFVWTPESEVVETIDCELRKEHRFISTLTVRLWDKRDGQKIWPIFNALPDPAFSNVPIQLYLSKPGEGQAASKLVFDGKVGSLQPGYPGDSHLTIVAHDNSIAARLKASYKTFKNRTSVQLAQQIAQTYGLQVDLSELGSAELKQRLIDIGANPGGFSDWAQVTRALRVDGLELYMNMKSGKLVVRKIAQLTYPTTFTPDDGNVISLEAQVNHVHGPGGGGVSRTPTPGGNRGVQVSATGSVAQEGSAEGSIGTTHRVPAQGPKTGSSGAHTESIGDLKGPSEQRRRRKDTLSLTLRLTPDIDMRHIIAIKGWGQKLDGKWYPESIRHNLVSGSHGQTTLSLITVPSSGSLRQAGIAQPAGTK